MKCVKFNTNFLTV